MISRPLMVVALLLGMVPGAIAGERMFGSNMDWMGYPGPRCAGLTEEAYDRCMERYRQGARVDARKIQGAADEARGRGWLRYRSGYEAWGNLPRSGYPSVEEVCEGKVGREWDRCVRQYVKDAENDAREAVGRRISEF